MNSRFPVAEKKSYVDYSFSKTSSQIADSLRPFDSLFFWRRRWDSNPRLRRTEYRFSRAAPSATRPLLLIDMSFGRERIVPDCGTILSRPARSSLYSINRDAALKRQPCARSVQDLYDYVGSPCGAIAHFVVSFALALCARRRTVKCRYDQRSPSYYHRRHPASYHFMSPPFTSFQSPQYPVD